MRYSRADLAYDSEPGSGGTSLGASTTGGGATSGVGSTGGGGSGAAQPARKAAAEATKVIQSDWRGLLGVGVWRCMPVKSK
ncbi:hypothetical protein GCM10028785_23750 [Hydrogenophaga soli]